MANPLVRDLVMTVYDAGAGVGRQIKYFRDRFPKVEYRACDVEPSDVGWPTTPKD